MAEEPRQGQPTDPQEEEYQEQRWDAPFWQEDSEGVVYYVDVYDEHYVEGDEGYKAPTDDQREQLSPLSPVFDQREEEDSDA